MAAILNLKSRHLNGISQDDNIWKWIQHTQIRLKKLVVDFSSKTPPELYPAVYLRNPCYRKKILRTIKKMGI